MPCPSREWVWDREGHSRPRRRPFKALHCDQCIRGPLSSAISLQLRQSVAEEDMRRGGKGQLVALDLESAVGHILLREDRAHVDTGHLEVGSHEALGPTLSLPPRTA